VGECVEWARGAWLDMANGEGGGGQQQQPSVGEGTSLVTCDITRMATYSQCTTGPMLSLCLFAACRAIADPDVC
jgi:hypothetical protein